MPRYARVVFNHPLRDWFTYRIPEEWESPPPIGGRVRATFSRRPGQIGIVLGYSETCDFDEKKVLPLEESLDNRPVFPEGMVELIEWMSEYYFCSMGEALFAAFPFGARTEVRLPKLLKRGPAYQEALERPRLSKQRRRVLGYFDDSDATYEPKELREIAKVGQSVVKALVDSGALAYTDKPGRGSVSAAEEFYRTPPPELNTDQKASVDRVQKRLREGGYELFLLHGVTGSGKTEVFLRAIEETLSVGKSALVLVPEIALTPQTAARYRGRFPGQVEVLHSGLSQARRFDAWRRVREGKVPVVVGTRSAVFAPLPNLGLVVVDEEHDSSYKQAEPAPRYHARDVATYRGLLSGSAVVLGSATPSLESYENVSRKKATLLTLPRRATVHPLPKVQLVDMRYRPPSERILSHEAIELIGETLGMGMQTILFLNRRGHSTQLACRECGLALGCQNCSVTLVWHESDRTLRCHHCSYRQPEPEVCPGCGSVWIRARGCGTQQVAQSVEASFPAARVERIDLDTTREEGAHDRILSALRKGEIDILVGTQMVSKGLDMPGVRLVVVVQAETSLNIADFRAAERSFALLTQVAGRAGRGEEPGKVLVQSFQPQHYSIRRALDHDYLAFRSQERRFRSQLGLPPHTRLFNCRVEGTDEEKVRTHIQSLVEFFSPHVERGAQRGTRLIGPTPCPLERIQNRYRWQFLVATRDALERKAILESSQVRGALLKQPSNLRVIVDVDPVNLL